MCLVNQDESERRCARLQSGLLDERSGVVDASLLGGVHLVEVRLASQVLNSENISDKGASQSGFTRAGRTTEQNCVRYSTGLDDSIESVYQLFVTNDL
jgi:hypothetical protein